VRAKLGRAVVMMTLFLLVIGKAAAIPPLPSSFYGRVTLGGLDVSPNTRVSAWINGVQYARDFAVTYEGHSYYTLNVPGEDVESPEPDGGVEGDVVVFYVGSCSVPETGIWHSATSVSLDLSAEPARLHIPLLLEE